MMYAIYIIFGSIFLHSILCDDKKTSSIHLNSTRNSRIWSGEEASINQFPYLINMDYDLKQNCGGSILTPYFIITASHCIEHDNDPNSYKIRAGSTFRDRGGSVHYIRNFIKHPGYTHSEKNPLNDLAIIRLWNPIIFDNVTKKSIPMFESGKESQSSNAIIAGWGCVDENKDFRPEELYSLKMNIIGKNQCRNIYKNDVPLNEGEICASANSNDDVIRGFCRGDSGGPLVIDGKLAGVAKATGRTQDSNRWPNKFTEISHYRKWIDGVVDYKLRVSKSIFDWSINKIEDLKIIVPEMYDNKSVVLFELHGFSSKFSDLQELLGYCSKPGSVLYKIDSYPRFDKPTDARITDLLVGVNIKPKCHPDLERQRISFRKKLYPDLCKEVTRQLISISKSSKLPQYNDLVNIEYKIKDCFRNNNVQNDRSCANIEKKVQEIDKLIQDPLNVVKNVGEFAINKNKIHVDSLINENIVKPVKKCNGTP